MRRVFLLLFGLSTMCTAAIQVAELRCEYQKNPVGLDVTSPRLTWILESDAFAQKQSAYQILVASDERSLTEAKADCWNSGKVTSDMSVNINYGGKKLESLRTYYWKVRAWDKDGQASDWSQSGWWITAVMDPATIKGQWITFSKPIDHEVYHVDPPMDLKGAKWIWYPGENAAKNTAAARLKFSRSFEIGDIKSLTSAKIALTVDNSFKLSANGKLVGTSSNWQTSSIFDLAEYLVEGKNLMEIEAVNDAASPAGLLCKVVINNAEKSIELVSDKDWEVYPAENPSESKAAQEIANFGDSPWGQISSSSLHTFWTQKAPSPLLRKEFNLKDEIESAYAVIAGLGCYELKINGQTLGDKVLDPVFTNYTKTVLYSTYDVTDYLHQGANAVGIMLANGWYNSHTKDAWDYDKAPWRDSPKALLNLVVNYKNGTTETIVTDTSWQGSNGPLVADAIRSGEVYDARLEQAGWDKPGFDSSGWEAAKTAEAPKGRLCAEMMPGTKIQETLKPIAITEPKPGVYLFDMGVNIAGWAKLTLSGNPGQKIMMRYGEVVKDGMLNVDNIRALTFSGPFQTDTYYLKGDGVETWHPRFVYHGFRYVEVTGLTSKPSPDTIEAQVLYTDFEPAGKFACSNTMFNTVQKLTERSYKGNFVGIPTDCPQREKNGWTADAHLAAELAMYNFNNVPAYEKWLADFRDDQDNNGRYSCIIPSPGWGARDLTEWDSAYMIVTWYLYLYRGDVRAIEDHYDAMKRYIENVDKRIASSSYIVEFGLGDWANDGGSQTSVPLTASAYFYYDTILMARFATILGKEADQRYFSGLGEKVKAAYQARFYKGDGIYDAGQQTASAMSLFYGLVPESEKEKVLAQLV
ncbi:MAG: family 78 glycoside hydrolase catalytic domain, partial [Anaerohalosphaeraceae bacterium]